MDFSSIAFLSIYLVSSIGIYYLVKLLSKNNTFAKNTTLFILSLIFYLYGGVIFFLSTLAYLSIIYVLGRCMERKKNKIFYILSLCFALIYLVVFKVIEVSISSIGMPLAISFISFQSYSYLVDIYKDKVKAEKNFVIFITYSLLFTKLTSGPIMAYKSLKEQFNSREENSDKFLSGLIHFGFGLGKKILIASFIYPLFTNIYSNINNVSSLTAWLGVITYGLFLYYDFSSYSNMAVGLSKMFGFDVNENFDYPYTSFSITDFWRRWHITLSLWFKEYVYFPLGGSRKGKVRTLLNVSIVFILTGLWHGFTLNFLLWGCFYALIMVIEKAFLFNKLDKCKFKPLNVLYCFLVINIGWVIFFTQSINEMTNYFRVMFSFIGRTQTTFFDLTSYTSIIGFIVGCLLIGFIQRPLIKKLANYKSTTALKVTSYAISIIIIVVSMFFVFYGTYSPSVYGGF